jgi:Icc-related predicted phosphoesterase
MRVKILSVSDTHEAFETLESVVDKEADVNIVLHSGDFASIDGWDLNKQDEALEVFRRTVEILKKSGKPVLCVPGNVRIK